MERWLVALDCQTFGVANSLQLMHPNAQVDTRHIWEFRADLAESEQLMQEYDHTLVSIDVFRTPVVNFSVAKDLMIVPQVSFGAYHPDIVAVYASEAGQVKTIMDDYNSMIALAAFEAGLSPEEAVKAFNGNFFERCGYLNGWGASREGCLFRLSEYGWDLRADFIRWSAGDAFMHSPNHPKIECLFDLSRELLRKRDVTPQVPNILPPDNLATGAICAIYPEIGEAYGVSGSYCFKPANSFRTIDLSELVYRSFDTYRGLKDGGQSLTCSDPDGLERISGFF